MARLLTCGWETASPVEATVHQAFTFVQVDTTNTRNADSAYSMTIPPTLPSDTGFQYQISGAVLADIWYARFYLFFTAAPSAAFKFFGMNTGTTAPWPNVGIELMMNTDRTLSLYHNNTARTPTSAALATSTWHLIEVRGISGTSGQSELKVNGTSVVSVSGTTGQSGAFTQCQFGSSLGVTTHGNDLYIDDFALNDSNGSAQNTWVGDTSLKLLTATADSAIGTGWITSGNNVTNLYTNINNIPPLGIADVVNNEGHQIRNGSNIANSVYDATLTSYSAAGLAASDVINVVHPVVMTAAPVSTTAKQGTVGAVSNPAGSLGALSAGGTAGAFWSGLATGTYPSGWKSSLGPPVYGDITSGNRGTAPVVRINQVTANTRIAMVTLLGLYVDYTPSTAPPYLPYRPTRGPNYRR